MMEEDIDIEEHDVLDNPRIKHIFPDLTIVKTETLDEEEEFDEQVNEGYISVNGYFQYENDCDYYENGYYNNAEEYTEEEDIENYTNKIILGSKPSTKDTEEYSIKKEYLPAVVMLEDWGERLSNSSCYCKDCKILFATNNALDYHKMAAHSFLVAITNKAIKSTARKSTIHIKDVDKFDVGTSTPKKVEENINVEKNKLCNHCNKYFPDGNTLIKHLYELLTKNDTSTEAKKSQKTQNFDYQCNICQKLFLSYSGGKVHLANIHPNVDADENIIKVNGDSVKTNSEGKISMKNLSIMRSSINSNSELVYYWYSSRTFIKNPPIPKSILFKCFKCRIHFVMALRSVHHRRYCSGNSQFLGCGICKKKVHCHDILLHKMQHKVSSEFKIYQGGSRNYRRTLCKCPKCSVCYSETKFWPHYKVCVGKKTDCDWCKICAEFIHSHINAMHTNIHKTANSVKNDFIIITYAKEVNSKRVAKTERIVTSKKKKLNEGTASASAVKKTKKNTLNKKGRKFPLFYCNLCNCCIHKNWDAHLANICRKGMKAVCEKCGLMFTPKSIKKHKGQHDCYNVTLYDFDFISRDGSRIVPKVPDFYKCPKCNVHYLTKLHRRHHKCDSQYETCPICMKKYNSHAFKLHTEFHEYVANDKRDEPETIDTPDPIKTYNSLNKMWNILFLCEACGVNTDSYDEAVNHSQSHLVGSTDTEKQARCKVCDLKFDSECYKKHMRLHKQLPVNKKDFLILPYRYRALFKNQWFNLFGKLAPRKVQQIISQSIYRDTRRVNMRIVAQGRSEYTLYVCKLCKVCVRGQEINKHIRSYCSEVDENLYCPYCEIFFDSNESYKRHVKIHEKIKFGFKVVVFEPMTPLKTLPDLKSTNLESNGDTFLFYKCALCGISVLSTRAFYKKHVCYNGAQTTCNLCGLATRIKSIASHMRLHRKYPTLSKETTKYQIFHPANSESIAGDIDNSEDKLALTTDCDPQLGTFQPDVEKTDKDTDNKKLLTSKLYLVTCKTCRLVFKSRREMTAHYPNCNGKVNGKIERDDETQAGSDAVLYKCSRCSCHFLHRKSWRVHGTTCESVSRVLHECDVCGLGFTLISLKRHKLRDHLEEKYSFKVIEPDTGKTCVYSV